ncbi:DUF2268 domain-containing protein [Vibrio parahaemolyticus]|uniref:DUF2268 domain-containing protein n=1 Tax=Vibrio parahaemolyticus TaxID=670 RepID=UPI0032601B55|nr:hypothetical protein [Vibrio parahaemolyticus]HCE2405035.1 hypothetical protein [Vibrio parahaemolyticus]HCE2406440.1 hypothetical protein [Vibrio parahaemolyticus]HCE3082366.1 hypothetical protein [Vibrio parahaemolyticus]HCE3084873.1 hypothetical protein [Vibrio parahaemolyticus]
MSYRVTLLNATGALSPVADYLYEQLNSLSLQLADHFELTNIDVTISPFGHGDAPQSGIGGYCLSPYRVEVLLDTQRTDIKTVIENELAAVLAHELHHLFRMRAGENGLTLGEVLIMEGLACHFERQVNGGLIPSLFELIKDRDWRPFYTEMKDKLTSLDYNFDAYFLGSDESRWPKYMGYWVGYNLVAEYLANFQGSELDLVGAKAEIFYQ